MKKFSFIVLLFFAAFILAACDRVSTELSVPSNVIITSETISWDAVEGATSYVIVIGSNEYPVTGLSYDLSQLDLAEGTYQVRVMAVKGDKVSLPSTAVNYLVITQTDLNAPTNVRVINGVLTWNSVTNALSYVVIINGVEYTSSTTTFNLNNLLLEPNTYSISVKAVRNLVVSTPSTPINHQVLPSGNTVLIMSTLLQMMDETYLVDMTEDDFDDTWAYDEYYQMSIMVEAYASAMVSLDMSVTQSIQLFEYVIFDMPVLMATSESVQDMLDAMDFMGRFNIEGQDVATVIFGLVNGMLGIVYEQNHQWLEHLLDVGADELEALLMYAVENPYFSYMYNKLTSFMTIEEIDLFDAFIYDTSQGYNRYYILNMFAYIAADLFTNFNDFDPEVYASDPLLFAISNAFLAAYDEKGEEFVVEFVGMTLHNQLNEYMMGERSFLIELFENYLSEPNKGVLSDLIYNDFPEDSQISYVLYQIVSDIYYNYENHDPYYLLFEDPIIDMFYEGFTNAYLSNDYFHQEILHYFSHLLYIKETIYNFEMYHIFYAYEIREAIKQPFYLIFEALWALSDYENQLRNAMDSLDLMSNLIAELTENRDVYIYAMANVVDYVELLRGSMSLTAIGLLNDLVEEGFLTEEELVVLKNEIVTMFLETMPSALETSMLYLAIMHLGASALDLDILEIEDHAYYLGELTTVSLELVLLLVLDVDLAMINEITLMVEEMIIPGEVVCQTYTEYDWRTEEYYEYEDCYYTGDSVDPVKLTQFVLYILTYLDSFKVSHQPQFDELSNLLGGEGALAFNEMILEVLMYVAQFSMNEEEFEIAQQMIQMIIDDLPHLYAGFELMQSIGVSLVDEFILSEAQFFIDLFTLIQQINDEAIVDFDAVFYTVEGLISDFVVYHHIAFSQLDQEGIETLLRMARLPFMFSFMNMGANSSSLEVFSLFDNLIVPVSQVLANLVVFEMAFVQVVSELEIADWFLLNEWMVSDDTITMFTLLTALNLTIDPVMEDLLLSTINLVIDDILGFADLMVLSGMTQDDLEDIRSVVMTSFEEMLIELRALALILPEDLDFEDEQRIFDFFNGSFIVIEQEPVMNVV